MFISALVALFAFGLAMFSSLRLNFYLGPTLLSFGWAFLIYALCRPAKWTHWVALALVILTTPVMYKFCANWKRIIDEEKVIMTNAYLDKLENALLEYRKRTHRFPADESFMDVVWIISELEIADLDGFKYIDKRGMRRSKRCAKPCLNDPWGAHYIYAGKRDHALLISSGPDLKIETPDDVVRFIKAP